VIPLPGGEKEQNALFVADARSKNRTGPQWPQNLPTVRPFWKQRLNSEIPKRSLRAGCFFLNSEFRTKARLGWR